MPLFLATDSLINRKLRERESKRESVFLPAQGTASRDQSISMLNRPVRVSRASVYSLSLSRNQFAVHVPSSARPAQHDVTGIKTERDWLGRNDKRALLGDVAEQPSHCLPCFILPTHFITQTNAKLCLFVKLRLFVAGKHSTAG